MDNLKKPNSSTVSTYSKLTPNVSFQNQTTSQDQVLLEDALNNFSNNDLYTDDLGSLDNLYKNLNLLNHKLDAVRKTFTFWDGYNIVGSAETSEELAALLINLPINQTISIKGENVFFNNERLSRGSLVYKDANNEIQIIPSSFSGYYYPSAIIKEGEGNTFILKYKYTADNPINGEQTLSEEPLASSYTNINIPINTASETIVYNEQGSLITQTNLEINIKKMDENQPIPPIIMFYLNGEDFYLPDAPQIDESNSKLTIINISPFTLSYVVK